MLSDEDIKKLWTDPKFEGAYSGLKNMKFFLKTQFNEVSIPQSSKIMV